MQMESRLSHRREVAKEHERPLTGSRPSLAKFRIVVPTCLLVLFYVALIIETQPGVVWGVFMLLLILAMDVLLIDLMVRSEGTK
jgi:Flp pilus assembly protein TadB